MNHLVVLCREKTKVCIINWTNPTFDPTWPMLYRARNPLLCVLSSSSFLWTQFCLIHTKRRPSDFNLYTTRSQPMCRRKTAIQWVLFKPIIKSNLLGTPSLDLPPSIHQQPVPWQNQTICQSASFDHKPAWYLQDESLSHDYFALLSLTCTSLHDYPMQIGHTFVMVRIDRKTILKLWHILEGNILRKHIRYTL